MVELIVLAVKLVHHWIKYISPHVSTGDTWKKTPQNPHEARRHLFKYIVRWCKVNVKRSSDSLHFNIPRNPDSSTASSESES